jgi:hypothetical protein
LNHHEHHHFPRHYSISCFLNLHAIHFIPGVIPVPCECFDPNHVWLSLQASYLSKLQFPWNKNKMSIF